MKAEIINIPNKFVRRSKTTLAVSLLLLLAACHQEFTLVDEHNTIVGNGTLETRVNFPATVSAVINDKEFSGTWDEIKVYDPDMAKMHKLINNRSYQEYMRGDSRHQLRRGNAMLNAKDGTQMECTFFYLTQPESGDCIVDGNNLKIKFSEGAH